jgi:uncharacterized protein YbcV (DUF1398 family)
MELQHKISEAYKAAANYPDLVIKLMAIGIESYTVEVSSGAMLYRLAEGVTVLHAGTGQLRTVAAQYNDALCRQAIKDNQAGKTDFPGFMTGIAEAGVLFYEATLTGLHKRVHYIGNGGSYEENIAL